MRIDITSAIMKKFTNGFGTKSDCLLLETQGDGTLIDLPKLNDSPYDKITHLVIWSKGIGRFELYVQHDDVIFSRDEFLSDKKLWRNAGLFKGGYDNICDQILKINDEDRKTTGVAYIHVIVIPEQELVMTRKNNGQII